MTSEPDAQPLADDELEHARRRQADPLVQVSQTERLLLQEVDRLRAVAEEHRQSARHSHYDVEALLLERERMEDEAARLRAENTALAAAVDQFRSFPDNPGPGNWSTSYRMGYADAGRDVRAITHALGLVQDREGQADA